MRRLWRAAWLCAALAAAPALRAQDEVPFVVTPDHVTLAMLELAQVGPQDFVLDLGSGDGRIVINAARRFGARGLGVEIVPELVQRSRANAARAGVAERARHLLSLAAALEAHAREFAALESHHAGKTVADAELDVRSGVATLRWFAGCAERLDGRVVASADALHRYVRREPLGVCGLILPWNFPLLLMLWKLAPALATGNTVVIKPASETPWTKKLWIYDLRTNKHFTLKTNPLKREDLDEFVRLYNPANRHQRQATWFDEAAPHPNPLPASREKGKDGRWRVYDYDELIARDKASLDIFWLKDESLADSDNLPPPEVIAQEIVDDLEAALEQFRLIAEDLRPRNGAAE